MDEERTEMERSYKKTQELMDKFETKHGTFICRKLLNGCELTSKGGQLFFKKNDLLKKICVPCVQSVVEILEEILIISDLAEPSCL